MSQQSKQHLVIRVRHQRLHGRPWLTPTSFPITLDKPTTPQGDFISLNGSTGEIIIGKQPLAPPELSGDLGR